MDFSKAISVSTLEKMRKSLRWARLGMDIFQGSSEEENQKKVFCEFQNHYHLQLHLLLPILVSSNLLHHHLPDPNITSSFSSFSSSSSSSPSFSFSSSSSLHYPSRRRVLMSPSGTGPVMKDDIWYATIGSTI